MGPYPTIVYIAIFKPFYKKFRTLDPQEKNIFMISSIAPSVVFQTLTADLHGSVLEMLSDPKSRSGINAGEGESGGVAE